MKETTKLKIGITLSLKTTNESIWTNGIKLNVLNLVRLLKRSKKEYEVCILNTVKLDWSTKADYLKGIDIYFFDEKFKEMDLIISMGAQVDEVHLKKFKEKQDKKVIGYKCGNNYVVTMENILFKEPEKNTIYQYEKEFDEIWYIPQQHETNYGFYRTLYRTNAIMVPFVWDNKFIVDGLFDIEMGYKKGEYKKGYKYNSEKKEKVIGIMEPNINIVKFALIPTLIAEQSYRTRIGKERIQELLITNSENISTNKEFLSIIETLDLYKEKKIFSEKRYQTSFILTQYIDVVISHQLLNPLNYLYLDIAYMGYPILHNAPLCKDLGYYYEGSNTIEASKKLNWILTEHDKNLEEYTYRNRQVLKKYSNTNEDLIDNYDKLIHNLFNGGNTEMYYDSEKNLCFKKN
jgi:hypothetical protein